MLPMAREWRWVRGAHAHRADPLPASTALCCCVHRGRIWSRRVELSWAHWWEGKRDRKERRPCRTLQNCATVARSTSGLRRKLWKALGVSKTSHSLSQPQVTSIQTILPHHNSIYPFQKSQTKHKFTQALQIVADLTSLPTSWPFAYAQKPPLSLPI